MPKPRHLLLALALCAVAAVVVVWRESEARTAPALLESADRRLGASAPDFDAALRDLDLALELALRDGDERIAQRIYQTRGRTYQRRGLLDRARADFVRALEEYAPDSPHLRNSIGWLDLQLGNVNAALSAAGEALKLEPKHSDALTLRGRALWTMGVEALDEVRAIADAELPDEEAERVVELAWRASTLDFGHPHRTATISEIQGLFGGRETFELERFVDEATTCLTQARGSFVEALETHPHVGAMAFLIELFKRGGQDSDVVDFGLAATAHGEVQQRIDALENLVAALDRLDRPAFASSILSEANEAELVMPPELMATWCRLLYEAGDWRRLEQIGHATIAVAGVDGRDLRATASFYKGFANLNLGLYQEALTDFRAYTRQPPRDTPPLENALAWAYYGQGQAYGRLRKSFEELTSLERAVEEAPDLDPELWVALAEAQLTRRQPASVAAESLARALPLADPRRRAEIFERWEEVSLLAMDERQRSLESVELASRDQGTYVLASDPRAPTWEWYALGLRYVERRHSRGAIEAARAILARYPDHVLGLDLWIEGSALGRSWRKLVELLLKRAELYGPYPRTEELIAGIPEGEVRAEELLLLMELDPKGTGLMRMVDELVREGRAALALDALAGIDPAERPPAATRRLAELYADAGLWSQALETAALVPTGSPEFARTLELALSAASAMKKPAVLELLVPDLLGRMAHADLDPVETERAARWLLAIGHLKSALAVYDSLDVPDARGATTLAGHTLAMIGAERLPQARETLDRAEAFGGPDPGLARIALCAAEGSWTDLPREIERLRASGFTPEPWVDAALLALCERVREAAAVAADASRDPDAAPEWRLLCAAANALLPPEDRRPAEGDPYPEQTERFVAAAGDPRRIFVLLALLSTPTGAAWTQRELTLLAAEGGRVWPSWLSARAMDALGHPDRALEGVEALLRAAPLLRAGWDRLERDLVALRGTALAPEMPALLERRFDALGPDPKRPVEALIVRAQKLVRDGAVVDALTAFEGGKQMVETSAFGLVNRARLLRVAGLHPEAVKSFASGLALLPPEEAALCVDEFLALGTQAFQERSISDSAWRAYLEALRADLPSHPTVSLALARVERQTADDPVRGWTLARLEYDRFRRATGGVSLDELEPGSAAAWAAFFLSENPREAEAMIRAELVKSPGSPDLWRLYGDALEEQGRIDEAFDRYVTLTRILPEPQTLRSAARILAARGSDHRLLQSTIDRIRIVERSSGPDVELELLRALSLAHGDPQGVRASLKLFEALWEHRAALRAPWQRIELATGYAVALLHAGDPSDGPRIKTILADALPRVQDPYRRDVLTAYLHMAQWMPEPPPPAPE